MVPVIPENEVTQHDLEVWYKMKIDLSNLKVAENLLRNKIFKGKFPNPKEGTNKVPLDGGYVLSATHSLIRDIDMAVLKANGERYHKEKIRLDEIIKWTPTVKIAEYRTLTEEQTLAFDECLIIKPGSPQLEIVLPKKRGKAGEKAAS